MGWIRNAMSVDIKSVGFIQAKHSSNFIVVLDCKVLNNEDLMKYGVDGMDTLFWTAKF